MKPLEIEMVAPSRLYPYARNARVHSKRQIKKIAESIREVGFVNPVLVDEQGEIIAGHGRVMAAGSLGLGVVPIIRLVGLSEGKKRALRLADNKLALDSRWSLDMLAVELKGLIELDVDITLTGFDTIEIDQLTTPAHEGHEDEESLTMPPIAVTRVGDLWACGNHRLLCGDARQASSYGTVLGRDLADMVFTDPPYNVPISSNVSGRGRIKHLDFQMASGEMSPPEFEEFLRVCLTMCRDFSRGGALQFVFGDWRMVGKLSTVGEAIFGPMFNLAVWVKPNGAMGSFYRSQHELIAIFKNGSEPHVNNVQLGRMGRYRTNVWQFPGASGFSKSRKRDLKDHPTVKPIQLVAEAIRDATGPGDLVLDPFGGAGTTLLAAEICERRAALIEIEPRFVDVTLRRFAERTGDEPCLLPGLVPFSEVREQRAKEGGNG